MSKYNAVKVTVDEHNFASKKEAARYQELKLLQAAGEISGLELQPKFPLKVDGVLVCNYIADFRYRDRRNGDTIEDVKGVRTPVYKIKKRLFEILYHSRILET